MTCAHCGCQTINGPETSRPTRWRQLTYHTRQGLHSTTQAALTGQSTNETRQPWGGNSLSLELDLPVHPDTHTHTHTQYTLSAPPSASYVPLAPAQYSSKALTRRSPPLSHLSLVHTHKRTHTHTSHLRVQQTHHTRAAAHNLHSHTPCIIAPHGLAQPPPAPPAIQIRFVVSCTVVEWEFSRP